MIGLSPLVGCVARLYAPVMFFSSLAGRAATLLTDS